MARLAVEQAYGYMFHNSVVYGMITTVNSFAFLRREKEGKLNLTRLIPATEPILQYYVSYTTFPIYALPLSVLWKHIRMDVQLLLFEPSATRPLPHSSLHPLSLERHRLLPYPAFNLIPHDDLHVSNRETHFLLSKHLLPNNFVST